MSFVELQGKTVSKTLRLDLALVEELETEARRANIPFSNLVLRIIHQYLDFLRYNHNRNFINIGNSTLKSLLGCTSDEELYDCGYAMGGENPFARVFRAGMKPDRDSLLIYLRTLDVYANWFSIDVKTFDKKEYLVVSHNHGERWWCFLRGYFEGIFKKMGWSAEVREYQSCYLIHIT